MNLLQLRSVCEIADNRLNISDAANALFRTQSTITRQIQELEEELGVEIFCRRKNKVLGITPSGRELIDVARRLLRDADTLTQLKKRNKAPSQTQITIATTHTQARYFLPSLLSTFNARYPTLRFNILQATPPECYQLVQTRQAELAFCSDAEHADDILVELPSYRCEFVAVAPLGHPLLSCRQPVSSEDIAKYPLIVIDRNYESRHNLSRSLFTGLNIQPAIALTSGSWEACKSYVTRGMGVAIILKIAIEDVDRQHLGWVDLSHLCAPVMVNVVVRRDAELGDVTTDFIQQLMPSSVDHDFKKLLRGAGLPPNLTVPLH